MPGIDLGSPETVMNQGYCLQGTYISREKIKVKDKEVCEQLLYSSKCY